jgi:AbrB family looped-hinge helix DNA binding protein
MESILATVSSKGQLVIPSSIREEMGIQPGTRVAIRREGDVLILSPLTLERGRRLIAELCGITSRAGSLAEELIVDRREEDDKSGW